eukprot:11180719-Lingulodinium_polyedra.AAC.1
MCAKLLLVATVLQTLIMFGNSLANVQNRTCRVDLAAGRQVFCRQRAHGRRPWRPPGARQ